MQFDKFKDYMRYLLHYPIKDKQFFILFTVTGNIFDQIKATIFEMRKQANILTADGKYLDMFGKDFQMPRIRNEDDNAYRRRLLLKVEISIRAGTEKGMLLVLTALGYEKSRIEPVYLEDSERWAEFIVYLSSAEPSLVNDLTIIDEEIMKVKQASAKPAYAFEEFTNVEIASKYNGVFFRFIYCNEIVCGEHPGYNNNVGHQFSSTFKIGSVSLHEFIYPLAGTITASERFYQPYQYSYGVQNTSQIKTSSDERQIEYSYPTTGAVAASEMLYRPYQYSDGMQNMSCVNISSGVYQKEDENK